jgi:trk system potassium uptake protein TrkH
LTPPARELILLTLAPQAGLSDSPRSLVLLGIAATVCLLIELGWDLGPGASAAVHTAEWLVASFYVVAALRHARLAGHPRRTHVRVWLGRVFLATLAVGGVVSLTFELRGIQGAARETWGLAARVLSVLVIALVALRSLGDFARAHDRLLSKTPRVEVFLVGGFALLTLVGAALLMMPEMATGRPFSLVDALFTSTSASCVTGLAVRDTGTELAFRGQVVLTLLFQLGGLGIVTFIAFGTFITGKQHSVQDLSRMQTLVQADSMANVRQQVLFMVASALCIELIGVALLYAALPADGRFPDGSLLTGGRLWWATFHTVSAFCNAGFGLEADSLVRFRGDFSVNATIALLFVIGGLGAPVLRELLRVALAHTRHWVRARRERRYIPPLSMQARLALTPTLVLLPLGAALFWLFERNGALAGLPGTEVALASAFQSATPRTAGFATLDYNQLSDATLVFQTGLMVIGASPMSTGGGIKTVTLMVLLLTLRAAATAREEVEYRGRVIARAAVRTALSVTLLYVGCAANGVLVLSLTDPDIALRDRIFETVSALSTVGLSTGVTASWSDGGKLVLTALMFLGRVGPATLMLGAFRPSAPRARFRYPTDPVILG